MNKISVIVPIYGVERYLEQCLRALFTQTMTEDVEFILVNDCTRDHSMLIAKKVITEFVDLNIIVIDHEQNKGLAATRQTGIDRATGEFILHTDSDDWCEPTMLEDMYSVAKDNDADIVICDWTVRYPKSSVVSKQSTIPEDGLECIKLQLKGSISGSLCTKLCKRSLYVDNNLRQIPGLDNNEDGIMSVKLLSCAKKIKYIPQPFYNYRKNNYSMSFCLSDKAKRNLIESVEEMERYFTEKGVYEQLYEEMIYRKLFQKHYLLSSSRWTKKQKEYIMIFPETNSYIFSDQEMSKANQFAMMQAVKGRLLISNIIYSSIRLIKKLRGDSL